LIRHVAAAVLAMTVLVGLITGCGSATGLYIAKDGTYYRNEDGTNHVGFLETEEGVRYFQADGRMFEEGLIEADGETYCFENGLMVTGWREFEGHTYYFGGSGAALRGEHEIDGERWLFDESTGVLLGRAADYEVPEPDPSAEPSAPPTEEPAEEPSPEPIPLPGQSPEPTQPAKRSAAVGELTGDERLDEAVKEVIDEICDPDRDAEYNLGEVFDWMVEKLKYKYIDVDLSNGYTEELVRELAKYIILNRRGSCEHQAALMAVFAMRLGHESIVVAGEFLSDDGTEWVEHAWVLANVDGEWYHFDPLYGRNHTGGRPRTFFMKKDADIEAVHCWDRDAYPAAG
jgi:uncharacterized protein YceK